MAYDRPRSRAVWRRGLHGPRNHCSPNTPNLRLGAALQSMGRAWEQCWTHQNGCQRLMKIFGQVFGESGMRKKMTKLTCLNGIQLRAAFVPVRTSRKACGFLLKLTLQERGPPSPQHSAKTSCSEAFLLPSLTRPQSTRASAVPSTATPIVWKRPAADSEVRAPGTLWPAAFHSATHDLN